MRFAVWPVGRAEFPERAETCGLYQTYGEDAKGKNEKEVMYVDYFGSYQDRKSVV